MPLTLEIKQKITAIINDKTLSSVVKVGELSKLFFKNNITAENFPANEDSPLHLAAEMGDVLLLKFFLQSQIPLTPNQNGWYPIHIAAAKGHLEVIKFLLDHSKADIDLEQDNEVGDTPLHTAARNKHWQVMEYLLSQGACNLTNKQGKYPLGCLDEKTLEEAKVFFKERREQAIAEMMLIVKSAELNEDEKVEKLEIILNHNLFVAEDFPVEKASVFNYAMTAEPKQLKILEIFVKKGLFYLGLDFDEWCYSGNFNFIEGPLNQYLEVISSKQLSAINKIEQLKSWLGLFRRFPTDLVSTEKSPLFIATQANEYEVVKFLLQTGIRHVSSHIFCSPIHCAAEKGYLEIVKLLHQFKVDINLRLHTGSTPLHYAAKEGHSDVVKFLLENKAISVIGFLGELPIHCAVGAGHRAVVSMLLEYYPRDIEKAQTEGARYTPLLLALKLKKPGVVKFLLSKGAKFIPNHFEVIEVARLVSDQWSFKLFREKVLNAEFPAEKDSLKWKQEKVLQLLQLVWIFNSEEWFISQEAQNFTKEVLLEFQKTPCAIKFSNKHYIHSFKKTFLKDLICAAPTAVFGNLVPRDYSTYCSLLNFYFSRVIKNNIKEEFEILHMILQYGGGIGYPFDLATMSHCIDLLISCNNLDEPVVMVTAPPFSYSKDYENIVIDKINNYLSPPPVTQLSDKGLQHSIKVLGNLLFCNVNHFSGADLKVIKKRHWQLQIELAKREHQSLPSLKELARTYFFQDPEGKKVLLQEQEQRIQSSIEQKLESLNVLETQLKKETSLNANEKKQLVTFSNERKRLMAMQQKSPAQPKLNEDSWGIIEQDPRFPLLPQFQFFQQEADAKSSSNNNNNNNNNNNQEEVESRYATPGRGSKNSGNSK